MKNYKINISYFLCELSVALIALFIIFGRYGRSIRDYCIIIAALVGAINIILRSDFKIKISLNSYLLFYVLFAVYSMFTIIWCSNLTSANTALKHIALALCMGISIKSCSNNDDSNIDNLLNIFLYSVVIASFYCVIKENISLLSWARLGTNEYTIAGEGNIYYSCCLIIASFISIHKLFSSEQKVVNSFIFAFIYICGILTGVRKCMIIPLLFLFLYVSIKNKKNILKFIGVILLTGIFAAIVVFIVMRFSSSMAARINSLITDFLAHNSISAQFNSSMNSYSIRTWLRNLAIELFLKYPIFGYGIGQFRIYSVANNGPLLYAHNNWLELLSCTGIIGFTVYYAGIFGIAFKAYKELRNRLSEYDLEKYSFILSSIISLFIMDYGQVSYYYLMYIFIYCALDGLAHTRPLA